MFNGLNNKLANVPTVTGLSNVDADVVTSSSVDTETLTLNGVDVGAQIAQIPINTAAIAGLQQVTTGQSYASVGDTTTFDNNVTINNTLIANGVNISTAVAQIPINTAAIAGLQQVTTGQSYVSVGDTTTFDNNVTLTSGKTMTADNFTGLASNASQVLVSTNNDNVPYYPTFVTDVTSQKSLLMDSSTTPLSYVPFTSTLSATNFTAGTNVTTPNILSLTSVTPSNARSILLNGTPFGNAGNTSSVVFGTNAGAVGTMPNNCFCFGTNAGASLTTGIPFSGVQNLFIGANSGNSVTSGRNNTFLGGSSGRFTTSGEYNTQIGSQSQSFPDNNYIGSYNTTIGAECYILNDGLTYSTAIGSGTIATTSNTVQIGRNVDTSKFDGNVTVGGTTNLAVTNITGTNIHTGVSWFNNNFLVSPNALGTSTTFRLTTQGGQTFIQAGSTNNSGTTADIVFSSIYSATPWVTMNNLGMTVAANNVTLGGGGINIGAGAGSAISNLICGNTNAKSVVFTAGNNTVLGGDAGSSMTAAAANNTYVGSGAGTTATNSVKNTCIGSGAGTGITSGLGSNVFVGFQAGFQSPVNGTGTDNICIGSQAGTAMTGTANGNVLIGGLSGWKITSGVRNVLVGGGGDAITSGNDNTIIGRGAGTGILTTLRNTILGAGAGTTIIGSDNICIGSTAQVPVAANSNQIAIGRVNETMYIQGGFNWRVGQITNSTNGTLNAAGFVLCQLYMVAMTAASQTITLPNPATAAYIGATVMFKRKTNTTAFTLTQAAGFLNYGAITIAASPYAVPTTIFQVDLVSDGTNWCIVAQR